MQSIVYGAHSIQDALSVLALMDRAYCRNEDLVPQSSLDRRGEGDLVAGLAVEAQKPLLGVVPARRDVNEVDAMVGEDARELHGLLDAPRRLVREDILQPFRSGHTNK